MKIIILTISIILILTKNSFSYVDPGTGSIIIQALAAGIAAVAAFWANLKFKIFGKKKNLKKDNKEDHN